MKTFTKSIIYILAITVLLLLTMATPRSAYAAVNVTVEQCANGANNEDPTCTSSGNTGWITGNVNSNKATYRIGDFLPHRQTFEGLTTGNEYCFGFGWDVSKDGKPAIDYISTYNLTLTQADPTIGYSFDVNSPTSTIAIPADPALTGTMAGESFTGTQQSGVLTMWGGTLTPGSLVYSNDGAVDLATKFENSMEYCFTATSTDAIIAWAGHIADPVDWGGLARPTGSPYHASNGTRNGQFTAPRTSMTDLSCEAPGGAITHENKGRSDVQLQAAAVENLPRDWGDLPDGPYPTLATSLGATHIILDDADPAKILLGSIVDTEGNGQPNAAANGDDVNPSSADDEDGVLPVPDWDNGANGGLVDVTVGGNGNGGWLCAWFDFGSSSGTAPDGTFDSFVSMAVNPGSNNVNFDIPSGVFDPDGPPSGSNVMIYARFRLFASDPGNCALNSGYTGSAENGEVEDYKWTFSPTAVSLQAVAASVNDSWQMPIVFTALALFGITILLYLRRRPV